MERNRNENRVRSPKLVTGLRHQPAAEARQFRSVAIFELADKGAGDVVVNHR